MIEDFVGSGSEFGMEVSYSQETNQLLARIGGHYDSIVPVMKRNAVRVEEAQEKAESSFLGNLFGEPQGQEN